MHLCKNDRLHKGRRISEGVDQFPIGKHEKVVRQVLLESQASAVSFKSPGVRAGGVSVYILFDGYASDIFSVACPDSSVRGNDLHSMPLYVGKGNIKHGITDARRSKRRGQLRDRFSWYAVAHPKMMHDLEVLGLRILPRYLRELTRQEGHFLKAQRVKQRNDKADAITRRWNKTSQ